MKIFNCTLLIGELQCELNRGGYFSVHPGLLTSYNIQYRALNKNRVVTSPWSYGGRIMAHCPIEFLYILMSKDKPKIKYDHILTKHDLSQYDL